MPRPLLGLFCRGRLRGGRSPSLVPAACVAAGGRGDLHRDGGGCPRRGGRDEPGAARPNVATGLGRGRTEPVPSQPARRPRALRAARRAVLCSQSGPPRRGSSCRAGPSRVSWESAAGQSASISMEARASTRLPRAHSSPPEAEGLPPRPPADRSAPPLDRSERARHARARAVVVVQCVRTCATKLSCIHRLSRQRAHTRAGVRSDGATSHRALRDTRRSSVLAFPRRC